MKITISFNNKNGDHLRSPFLFIFIILYKKPAVTEKVAYTTDRETEYITERDILGSVMEIISPRSAPQGSDLILEDGKRRIASMDSALFTNKLPGGRDNTA